MFAILIGEFCISSQIKSYFDSIINPPTLWDCLYALKPRIIVPFDIYSLVHVSINFDLRVSRGQMFPHDPV